MEYKVYFLKSCAKGKYYIGCTANIEERLKEHNAGKTRSTRPYKPWKVIHTENFSDKKEAYKREWYLKHPKGYTEKLNIIKNSGEVA
ncbi:MAG: GIY-YIG nuclease family protein [Patescibacteria group bacterium]